MKARFRRSASASSAMAASTALGGAMSRISYRMHEMPHSSAAALIALTMLSLRSSRSLKVLSSEILPISERIVVCASCVMAKCGSSTPYAALKASTTFTYSTPSMEMLTLSRVMAVCAQQVSPSQERRARVPLRTRGSSRAVRRTWLGTLRASSLRL